MTKLIMNAAGQFCLEDNGVTTIIDKIVDEGKTLKLPTNSSNRQYYSIANFQKNAVNGELELSYKPSVQITKNPDAQPRQVKPLEDWLSPEDRVIFLELKTKAQKNRDEANTKEPMSAKEKLERKMAKLQEEIAKLEKGAN